RVFRDVARISDHDGNGLADVSHLLDGDRIVGDWSLHNAWHWPDQIRDFLPGDDAANAGQRQRARDIELIDARMWVRRTQDRREAYAGNGREIVDEPRPPAQQRFILLARDRRADPPLRYGPDCFQQNAVTLECVTPARAARCFGCLIYRTWLGSLQTIMETSIDSHKPADAGHHHQPLTAPKRQERLARVARPLDRRAGTRLLSCPCRAAAGGEGQRRTRGGEPLCRRARPGLAWRRSRTATDVALRAIS